MRGKTRLTFPSLEARVWPHPNPMETDMLKLKVKGMTCGHCAQTVSKAVEAVPAVQRAVVDLSAGEVAVEGAADEQAVRQAIEDAGYEVQGLAA